VLVGTDVVGGMQTSDALGFGRHVLPLPPGTPTGVTVRSQWFFLTNAACPGTGPVATSERLEFTTF